MRKLSFQLYQSASLQGFDGAESFFGSSTFGDPIVPSDPGEHAFGHHIYSHPDLAFQGSLWFSTNKSQEN